jgi:hypothetical protein
VVAHVEALRHLAGALVSARVLRSIQEHLRVRRLGRRCVHELSSFANTPEYGRVFRPTPYLSALHSAAIPCACARACSSVMSALAVLELLVCFSLSADEVSLSLALILSKTKLWFRVSLFFPLSADEAGLSLSLILSAMRLRC